MYAYNADIYCDCCGEKIKADCEAAGQADSGDTNDFPQWASDDSETDSPQHCGDCGEFIGGALTDAGAEYVREKVNADLAAGNRDSVAVTEWMPYYDFIEYDDPDADDDDFDDCDEPDDDSITTENHRDFYQYGRLAFSIGENDDYKQALRDFMEREKFWPGCFWISDHGNAHPIDLAE